MSNTKLPALPEPPNGSDLSWWMDWEVKYIHDYAEAAILADRERQAGEAVACASLRKPLQLAADALQDLIAAGQMAKDRLDSDIPIGEPVHPVSRRLTWPLSTALLAEKEARHALASLPAPQAVQAGWKLVPVEPTEGMRAAIVSEMDRQETHWQYNPVALYMVMLAAAPSPDGKAEQALASSDPEGHRQAITDHEAEQEEAPSDLSVLRRIHKLLVNQVRPALRSPVITKDVDDAAEALSALVSRTQTEAPSDSTLKLAEMILADCGHSTAISTRLRDRVAERIERHLAAQPTEASCRSTNADGHVLLPFEPTDEMEVAAEDAYEESGSPFPNWKAVYRAMRDAAPSPDGKAEQAEAPSVRGPWVDYQPVYDFALKHRIPFNETAAMVRAAYATQPPAIHEQEEAPSVHRPTLTDDEMRRIELSLRRYTRQPLDLAAYGRACIEAAFSTQPTASPEQAEAPSEHAVELYDALDDLVREVKRIPDMALSDNFNIKALRHAEDALARRPALATKPTAIPEQAEAPSDAAREVLAAGIVHHYGVPEKTSFACARRVLALATQPTASNAGERELLDQAHKQICHLINDLTLTIEDDGLTRYLPVGNLMYSNLVAALIELAPKMLAALATKPPAGEQKPVGHLSWGGFNLSGDHKSIDEAKRLLHEAGTVPELRSLLAEARTPQPEQVAQDREDATRSREQRAIGKAIERACVELPSESDGIEIRLERDAGTVYYLKDGYWTHIDSGDTFSSQIHAAIDAAIRAARARGEGQS